jgi:hypothetical protein
MEIPDPHQRRETTRRKRKLSRNGEKGRISFLNGSAHAENSIPAKAKFLPEPQGRAHRSVRAVPSLGVQGGARSGAPYTYFRFNFTSTLSCPFFLESSGETSGEP